MNFNSFRGGYILLLMVGFVCMCSCSQERRARDILSGVATYVKDSPDSALGVLESIPRDLHHLPYIRGPYALLYTQAQLGSGVVVTKDSLIRDAVTYYRLFGSRQERFLSWYYLGRVYQNVGNRESAMTAYLKAGSIPEKTIPPSSLSSLHTCISFIYNETFDYPRAVAEMQKALSYARLVAKMGPAEFRCYLNLNNNYFNLGDSAGERRYLDSAKVNIHKASWEGKMDYYAAETNWMLRRRFPHDRIERLLDSVQTVCKDSSYGPWDRWAETYARIGRPRKALSVFEHMPPDSRTAYSYGVLSEVYDSLGEPRKSLEAFKRYVALSDSLDMILYRQDTRFIEERHANQLRVRRYTEYLVFGILLLLVMGTASFYFVRKKRREEARMASMYEDLRAEYDSLQQISQTTVQVNDRAKALLGDRMRALGAFLTEEQPESLDRAASRLETLTENRKELVETIGLLFGVYHPRFISMLLEYGLTTMEVGFCCLYVLGFRTTEIGDVINRSGYYNISSDIRKKLPVEHMKISTWLNEQFQQLS